MRIYLRFKSCNLLPDDGHEGPKNVVFIDDIIKILLCLTIIYKPVLICHNQTGWIPLPLLRRHPTTLLMCRKVKFFFFGLTALLVVFSQPGSGF